MHDVRYLHTMRQRIGSTLSRRGSRRRFLFLGVPAVMMLASGILACTSRRVGIIVVDRDAGNGDAGTDAVSVSPFPVEEFARRMAAALCDNIGPCCTEEGLQFDAPSCTAKGTTTLQTAIDDRYKAVARNVTYNSAAAIDCFNAYVAITRACHVDTFILRLSQRIREGFDYDFAPQCDLVFTGTKPVGSSCTSQLQCAAGSLCGLDSDGVARCLARPVGPPPPRGSLGESCTRTCRTLDASNPCWMVRPPGTTPPPGTPQRWCYLDDGLFCHPNWTCQPLAEVGEACTHSGCRSADAFCEQGVCAPRRDSGPCDGLGEACTDATYCDATSMECKPRKTSGEYCSEADCPIGEVCRTRFSCGSDCRSTCLPPSIARPELCSGGL